MAHQKKGCEIMTEHFSIEQLTPEEARNYRGISAESMAKRLGLSKNAYLSKEKGITKFYVDEALNFCEQVSMPFNAIIFLKKKCHLYGTQK